MDTLSDLYDLLGLAPLAPGRWPPVPGIQPVPWGQRATQASPLQAVPTGMVPQEPMATSLARNQPGTPPFGEHPYVPFDTSAVPGTAFGTPVTGGGWREAGDGRRRMADGGWREDSALPPVFRLPPPASDLYAGYRDVYAPAQEPVDPVAQLLSTLGQPQPQAPVSRALTPPWTARPAQPALHYGTGQPLEHAGPTPGERALLRRSPAYARAIARIRSLDRMRARQGF